MTDIINDQILDDIIYLDSRDMNRDINTMLSIKLKNKLEGKCNSIGYILKDSIELINKSIGKCISIDGKNKIEYTIKYKAKVLSPTKGSIINCYINSITKAGVVAYIKLNELIKTTDITETSNISNSPMIILIPIARFQDNEIKNDMKLTIELTAIRIKFNNESIQAVGTPKFV